MAIDTTRYGLSNPQYAKGTAPASGAYLIFNNGWSANAQAVFAVSVWAYIDGTPVAGTDDDNLRLFGFTVGAFVLPVPSSGALYQARFMLQCAVSSNNVGLQAIAAGSAGAVYHCGLDI